jgi:hypothetical protein
MKKIILILGLIACVMSVNAQIRWPFGEANTIVVTSADTIDVSTDVERGINYIDWNSDTTILLTATSISSSIKLGDLLIIEATESTANADTINYGTGFTGLYDALPSGKTKVITFIYNGTGFKKVSSTQIN